MIVGSALWLDCVTVRPNLQHDPHAILDPSQRGGYPQALVDDGCMFSLSRGA
jgi:hypothetical protein